MIVRHELAAWRFLKPPPIPFAKFVEVIPYPAYQTTPVVPYKFTQFRSIKAPNVPGLESAGVPYAAYVTRPTAEISFKTTFISARELNEYPEPPPPLPQPMSAFTPVPVQKMSFTTESIQSIPLPFLADAAPIIVNEPAVHTLKFSSVSSDTSFSATQRQTEFSSASQSVTILNSNPLSFILLETGDFLLLEDGFKIVKE